MTSSSDELERPEDLMKAIPNCAQSPQLPSLQCCGCSSSNRLTCIAGSVECKAFPGTDDDEALVWLVRTACNQVVAVGSKRLI